MNIYLGNHLDIDTQTSDVLILDIEHALHPQTIPQNADNLSLQLEIIEAFKLRYNVTRQFFPNANLSAWAINSPFVSGQVNEGFIARTETFIWAGQLGMFDEIDYLAPRLFPTWGPNDSNFEFKVERHARTGIEYTQIINDSEGNPIPVVPILSSFVSNSNSMHDEELVDPIVARLQINTIQEYGSVKIILFWSGHTVEEIPQYFQDVKAVPCECFGQN